MKKLFSLFLAITVIAAMFACAVPVAISAASPIQATPLDVPATNRGWQYVKAVTTTMPLSFTTAQGLVVEQNSVYANQYAHESEDGAVAAGARFASVNYSENVVFGSSTGLIIYVKTDAANQIAPSFVTGSGKNMTPKVGYNYQVAALGDSEWITKQFGTGLTNSTYNGVFGFDVAFEGYVKIPYTSFGYDNSPSYVFNPETDAVSQIVYRFKGLGSNGLSNSESTTVYGKVVVGPVFVINQDSTSTKITVPAAYRPDPIEATPLPVVATNRGWQYVAAVTPVCPLNFTTAQGLLVQQNAVYAGSYAHENADGTVASCARFVSLNYDPAITVGASTGFIIYIKTEAANQIALSFVIGSGRNMTARVGYDYQVAALGDEEWTTAQFGIGYTNSSYMGVLIFDDAFEGYVKIPYTSFGYDNAPSYVFNPETDAVSSIVYRFKGLGSNGLANSSSTTVYGKAIVGPVFAVNQDSPLTEIVVDEQYAPQPLEIKSFDFRQVRAAAYNYSAEQISGTNNYRLYISAGSLSETPVKHAAGVSKWSYVENDDGKVASGGSTPLVMTPTVDAYMKDAQGMVFYVKFTKANKFSPCLTFNGSKAYMLRPGQSVYLLENGSNSWVEKTVDIGYGTNTIIYGMVTFDEAFEGYIKVPFSSCNNDSGFTPTFSGDNMSALTSVALRFKGIGDDTMYGTEVIAGITGYYTEDTPRPVIGNIAPPEYAEGDLNYDWKVNSEDLTAVQKSLLGFAGYTGREVTILDLVSVKKVLAAG